MTIRWNAVALGAVCLAAASLLITGDAAAQRRPAQAAVKARQADSAVKGKLETVYYGNAACNNKGCHGGDPPKKWFKYPDSGKEAELIARCVEANIYEEKDKHANAYVVLSKKGGLGERMGQILKTVDKPDGKGKYNADVTKEPACMACHGVLITDPKVKRDSEAVHFDPSEGISCAVCHGPHREWIANHGVMVTAEEFRRKPRKEREEKYGMVNLLDPVRRVELCSSCHVGSRKEGKFVTHEMYAAGHPPLPGFEISTFSEAEPRHWQLLREKSPSLQKELGLRAGEQEETLLSLIGGVVAFRETMGLLHEDAKKALAGKTEADKMLDLSHFDCWACHHNLEQKWRQDPRWTGKGVRKLGRPLMREWSADAMRLSAAYLKSKMRSASADKLVADLDAGLQKLQLAFDKQTGGDVKDISEISLAMAELTQGLVNEIREYYPTAEDTGRLAGLAVTLGEKRLLGYDSARQLGWMAEVAFNERHGKTGGPAAGRAALKQLDDILKLRLPEGRVTIESVMDKNMDAIDRYDAIKFEQQLKALAAGLK